MTVKTKQIRIALERPEAARLYSLIGSCLWLESVIRSHRLLDNLEEDSDLRNALGSFQEGMREVGLVRANLIQDEIFRKLCG